MQLIDSSHSKSIPPCLDLDAFVAQELAHCIPAVTRVCRRFTVSMCEADELCQESLLVAWRRRHSWTADGSVKSWVCAIARNLGRNARRKRRELLRDPELPEPAANQPSATDMLQLSERHRLLHSALAQLLADERQVLTLRYDAEWKAPRINAHLGLHGAGARAVLQGARRRLRRILDEASQAGLYDDLRLAS